PTAPEHGRDDRPLRHAQREAAAVEACRAATVLYPDDRFHQSRGDTSMKTSIATVSISGEFPEKLAAIAAAGFDGIEIFENDFLAFDGSPRDVGRMARDAG